jgi:16S rRNA (adenine1518-N6/adenine1519-N6)-dimethyltransferase
MSQHIPRKRFGQNFLQDASVIENIVHAVNPQPDDVVIEIGPGLGAITKPLLDRLSHLHVAEIDRDIIARLKKEFPPERLTIHEGDALKFDFGSITDGAFKIVGNLPYNISTPLLFHLASFGQRVTDMHFMLQKKWWTACWPSLPRRISAA